MAAAKGETVSIFLSNQLPDEYEYFELFETTGWNEDYGANPGQLLEVVKRSTYHVSAYAGNRLIGFGRLLSDGLLHAVIFDVIIHPDYRGQGTGKAIMNDLIDKCRLWKIRDIQLFCAVDKVGFYEKCGFVPRPENGPGMEIKIKY